MTYLFCAKTIGEDQALLLGLIMLLFNIFCTSEMTTSFKATGSRLDGCWITGDVVWIECCMTARGVPQFLFIFYKQMLITGQQGFQLSTLFCCKTFRCAVYFCGCH